MHNDIVLGFDFGMKWIGSAVGNTITGSASPLEQIKVKDGVPNWNRLEALFNEWRPYVMVVGVPVKIDGSHLYVTEHALTFISSLKEKFNCNVYSVDERMTTVEAKSELFKNLGVRGLTKANIDSFAAKLIVEQWMREHH